MDPRDQRISELEAKNTELEAENAELRAMVAQLMDRIAELEAKLGQDSSNSGKPPSSDPSWRKKKPEAKKDKKKRRRGGQKGHKKSERALVPVEEVDALHLLVPETCRCCGEKLAGEDPEPHRHQVTELPPVKPVVTEYQLHTLPCGCGKTTRAKLPDGVPEGMFGPRLMATVAMLTGTYRLSKREVVRVMAELFGVTVGLGMVSKLERKMSEALLAPVRGALEYVRSQLSVGMDETGWTEAKQRAWLWAAVTPLVTVFHIAKSRGSQVARELLGEGWGGFLTTDRFSAYSFHEVRRRQVCWAHLKRDFQAMVDRGGRGSRIGMWLKAAARDVAHAWRRARDGTLGREAFASRIGVLKAQVEDLLEAGTRCTGTKTAGVCKSIQKVEDALWTFAEAEGVEPTNNASERALRPAVLWRKGSFGTDSERGSRYVERMLTAVTSLRKQDRPVLPWLTQACEARLSGAEPPSLLPP